jgi:hypothetical protein
MGPQVEALVQLLQQVHGLNVVLHEKGVRQRDGRRTAAPSRAATDALAEDTPAVVDDMSRTLTTVTLA